MEQVIVGALERELGLRAACLVRTATEMRAVLDANPLEFTNPSRMMALFLSADPSVAVLDQHDPRTLDPDRVAISRRVVYQWCPDGVSKAPDVSTFVAQRWGVGVTGRNWNTVTRLSALLEAA